MELSDDDILRRVQRGERTEYIALFDRYYARVERYARWQINDPEAARDIASETFLRAYRSVDNFRVGEPVSYLAYLLTICRRLALSERARSQARPTTPLDETDAENTAWDRSELPLDAMLRGERCAMLHDALERLPAPDREIIQLAYESDLSRNDIMIIMNKPSITAVTSHLYRAMQRLKAVVEEQGDFAV